MQSGSFQTFLDFEKISSNQRFWNFYFIVFFFKNNQLKALFGKKMKNRNFWKWRRIFYIFRVDAL